MRRIASISLYLMVMLGATLNVNSQPLLTVIDSIKTTYDLVGGVVVVFCKDRIVEEIPFGHANIVKNIPVTQNTAFRVASISKSVTAIAILQLYERSLLNLDTDISTILGYSIRNPHFANTPITIRMLLSHTSSLIDGPTYDDFISKSYSSKQIPKLSDLLTTKGPYYTSSQFMMRQPGSYFTYSNLNYGILGTIVEKVSGLRFDHYCKKNIFEPLGISGSFNAGDLPNTSDIAVLYRKRNGKWVPQADNYNGIRPTLTNRTNYSIGSNALAFSPQGGLRISGADLSKIFRALISKGNYEGFQLLFPSTIALMFKPQWQYNGNNGDTNSGLFRSWGLGFHISTNTPNADVVLKGPHHMVGHPGEAYGLLSDAYIDPTNQIGFIFITNGSGFGYQTSSLSGFYSLETSIFDAINRCYGNYKSYNTPTKGSSSKE